MQTNQKVIFTGYHLLNYAAFTDAQKYCSCHICFPDPVYMIDVLASNMLKQEFRRTFKTVKQQYAKRMDCKEAAIAEFFVQMYASGS